MNLAHIAGLHVGLVESCSPMEIKVLLNADAPQDVALNTGSLQAFPRLNGYVLIPNEGGTVVATIARMAIEAAPLENSPRHAGGLVVPVSRRRLFVTPLGTLETKRNGEGVDYRLRRGIASYPSVGDSVVLPTSTQCQSIIEAEGTDRRVRIGNSRVAQDAPVTIDPDKLFGRHLGVFGNTGSGKSCSVAGLIRWAAETAADGNSVAARFIVLDPNGEYRDCFSDLEKVVDVRVFSVEPRENESQLTVPAWMWNGEEWASALDAAPGTQRPVLMQAIRQLRGAGMSKSDSNLPDSRLLFASQTRAFVEYLQSQRAQGVQAFGTFPAFKGLHQNLEGFEDQLEKVLDNLSEEDELKSPVIDALHALGNARGRRTDNGYLQGFQDADLVEIISALEAVREKLPTAGIVEGPSEDTPAKFDPHGLPDMIDLLASLQHGNLQQHMAGLDLRIRTLLADARMAPVITPKDDSLTLSQWLLDYLGSGEAGRGQITVIDLSLVPSDVRTTAISVLGRIVFEAAQRHRRQFKSLLPLVLVLEEAHNFVQRVAADREDARTVRCRHIFEKIAKEGRKFGVGLVISSQRPAELAPTVVAQCNSFILHRIVNDRDQDLISKLAPDSAASLLKELPSLPQRQAILMGVATEIPIIYDALVLRKAHQPSSSDPDFWDVWTHVRSLSVDFGKLAQEWSV